MPHAAGETMTSTRQVQMMRAVLFATVGLLALGLILVPAQEWRLTLEFVAQTAGNGLCILASLAVGALIVSRRPDNIIGRFQVAMPADRCPVRPGRRCFPTCCGWPRCRSARHS